MIILCLAWSLAKNFSPFQKITSTDNNTADGIWVSNEIQTLRDSQLLYQLHLRWFYM